MRKLMLDSGAFSVWSKGLHVDFDEYLEFCVKHPEVSYYVNLDVIPGRPGVIHATRASDIDDACQLSWDRYQAMIKQLPLEKVIPVFHQHDRPSWLERYVKFGTPYIGISPANDRTTAQKLGWLDRDVRQYTVDSRGNATVRTHGFAVTSHRLMKAYPWYSVDSSTWVKMAGMGSVYIPMPGVSASYDFEQQPLVLSVSPRSPMRDVPGKHYYSLSPAVRLHVDTYLSEMGVGMGEWRIVAGKKEPPVAVAKASFGLDVGDPLCYDTKARGEVIETVVEGIATNRQMRGWLNARFLSKANEALPIEDIYFAGSVSHPPLEKRLRRRLVSYHYMKESKDSLKAFYAHLQYMKDEVGSGS